MKYLISLYFDDNTNRQICRYMNLAAKTTGNDYMLANHVPPHITISSFEIKGNSAGSVVENLEQQITSVLQDVVTREIQWVGCGAFMSSILYLTPVLNEYLQQIMQRIYDTVAECEDVEISKFYKPFQWIPHTTIGKKDDSRRVNWWI